MDLQAVKELAQLMEDKALTELDVELDGPHVVLQKEVQVVSAPAAPQISIPVPAALSTATPAAETPAEPAPQQPAPAAKDSVVDFNNITEIKSPMVGTAYLAPSPEEEPYVKVGDHVQKGQVLCIIEAMKLMNEFTSPQAGEIVDICVEDGQLVEYGQCLFKIV